MSETKPTPERCKKCGQPRDEHCNGNGWMEAIGPCADGSYISSYPCPSVNPYYETH